MRKQLTLLLLLVSLLTNGQLFRAIQPVEPLTIAKNGNNFTTLVKKKLVSGNLKYYYVSSDSTGQLPLIAYRYGNTFTDLASVTIPSNYVSFFTCGFYDGLTVGSWTVPNPDKFTKIRRFNNAWWIVQEVDGTPSIDMFQPRGINFLDLGTHITTFSNVNLQVCRDKISSRVTGTGGLELTPNFTTPTGYVFDDANDVYQKSGSVSGDNGTTPTVDNIVAYVTPATYNFYDAGNQQWGSDRLINLSLTESNGSYTLTDQSIYANRNNGGEFSYKGDEPYKNGALVEHNSQVYIHAGTAEITGISPPAFPWATKSLEKRYFIGFGRNAQEGYSAAEMQAGINVDAWKGKEINVSMGYYPTTGELSYLTPTQQQLYIPGIGASETYEGGTYYNRHPDLTITASNKEPTFANTITSDFNIPDGKIVAFDILTENELSNGTSYGNLGIHSRTSINGKLYIFISDGWLEALGHPCAYNCTGWQAWWDGFKANNGGLTGATEAIRNQFNTSIIQPYANAGYVMLNNELKGQWNSEFQGVIKACYADWKNSGNQGILSSWLSAVVGTNFTLDKAQAYTDWTTTEDYNAVAAQSNRFVKLMPKSFYRYEGQVNQIGNYFTDRNPYNTPQLIAQALYTQKWKLDIPQKTIPTMWNRIETLSQPLQVWYGDYGGVAIKAYTKQMVSPHDMRNYASASAFFTDGLHVWHDGYAVKNSSNRFYPFRYINLTTNPETEVNDESYEAGQRRQPYFKETNIDWAVSGLWTVYKSPTFTNITIQIADINDGTGWRTGADAFVIGAAVDSKPFAAYKRVGNSYQVWACDFFSKINKDIQIRMKDGSGADVIKTVKLRGNNASVIIF